VCNKILTELYVISVYYEFMYTFILYVICLVSGCPKLACPTPQCVSVFIVLLCPRWSIVLLKCQVTRQG